MRKARMVLCVPVVAAGLAFACLTLSAQAATRRASKPASTARVTLAMGEAFHDGGVLTGARLSARGGARYQRGRLSLAVAKLTVAPSRKRATLALTGSVRLTDGGRQLLLSKIQVRFDSQGNVTFSTRLPGGGRAGVFTGMANSSPITASGVSASSAPMALGDGGNRLVARLMGVPVEEVQAQFIGDMKTPKVAASHRGARG